LPLSECSNGFDTSGVNANRVPPHAYFVVSAVFHYLGPAFAVLLFARIDVLGVAWLRIATAAVVFAVWRRPWRVWARLDTPTRRLLVGWAAVLAAMNSVFYLALERLPLGTVAAIEFLPVVVLAAVAARTGRNVLAPANAQHAQLNCNPIKNVPNALPYKAFVDDVFFERSGERCHPDSQTLCLDRNPGDQRFQVRMTFHTAQNGGHADPLDPWTFARWVQFLSIFVAQKVPEQNALTAVASSTVANLAFGATAPLPDDPFAGVTSYDRAKAIFERFPRVRILFENGGGADPGAPEPRFEAGYPSWPIPGTEATAWYFGADGTLVTDAPVTVPVAASVALLNRPQ